MNWLPILSAYVVGLLFGAVIVAFFFGRRDTAEDDLEIAAAREDSALLDYLEVSECSLYFNPRVDGGAWGLVDGASLVLGIGRTARQALTTARNNEAANAANVESAVKRAVEEGKVPA